MVYRKDTDNNHIESVKSVHAQWMTIPKCSRPIEYLLNSFRQKISWQKVNEMVEKPLRNIEIRNITIANCTINRHRLMIRLKHILRQAAKKSERNKNCNDNCGYFFRVWMAKMAMSQEFQSILLRWKLLQKLRQCHLSF